MKSAPVPLLEDMPDLMTMPEVARVIRSGPNYPYDLVHTGRLKAIKLGRKLLAPKAAVARLMSGEE